MTKRDVVRRIHAVLDEAYEEAAYLVVAYVEQSGVPLRTFCREVCEGTPHSYRALDSRARRLQEKAHEDAESSVPRALSQERIRHARSAIQKADEDDLNQIVSGLTEDAREDLYYFLKQWMKTTPIEREKTEKTFTQKFSDAAFRVWKLHDELQDVVPDAAEADRLRVIAQATLGFCESLLRSLDDGQPMSIDDELHRMIEEAHQS